MRTPALAVVQSPENKRARTVKYEKARLYATAVGGSKRRSQARRGMRYALRGGAAAHARQCSVGTPRASACARTSAACVAQAQVCTEGMAGSSTWKVERTPARRRRGARMLREWRPVVVINPRGSSGRKVHGGKAAWCATCSEGKVYAEGGAVQPSGKVRNQQRVACVT